ncbi:MAG TPA: TIGR02611 family protein [Actinomycetospora sp.]|uniref:TIGR02611 family protein n=1 Tax=Actinomycetospora sp. TaxID=1872135 RepID=UPI002F3EADDA
MTPPQATPDRTVPDDEPGPLHDGRLQRVRVRLRAFRARVKARPWWNLAWRIAIGVLGTAVLVLGLIAIPYPGPGWLIVFAGLGILATEFTWAGRLLRFVRRYYDRWVAWVRRQNRVVQALLGLATLAVVLTTLWLLDALWLVARLVGLGHWTWLHSPIMA